MNNLSVGHIMRRTSLVWVAAVVAIGSMVSATHAGVILTNGDFSTGDLTGWTWTPDTNADPGMVASVDLGPFGTGDAFNVNAGTSNGLERGGVLSQNVFLLAGSYTYSGEVAIQDVNSPPDDPFGNADGGVISAVIGVGETIILDLGQIGVDQLTIVGFSIKFDIAADQNVDIGLHFTRTFFNAGPSVLHWADNLSVVPAPGALTVLAFGVLAVRRRRRV